MLLALMRHESIAGRVPIHSQAFLFLCDEPKIVCEHPAILQPEIRYALIACSEAVSKLAQAWQSIDSLSAIGTFWRFASQHKISKALEPA